MTRYILAAAMGFSLVGCGSEPAPAPPASDATPAADGSEAKEESGSGAKEDGSGTTEVKFNMGDLPTLAVHVPGIHCEACAANVDRTLAGVAGVEDVKICVTSKTATLAIDQAAFDTEAAVKALAEANFDGAEVVLEGDEPTTEGEAEAEAS